ncbi:hypothetical protein C8R44DRAFT_814424 [Mycena epipterygia]|nr:hypothetical protein C8R44DRAFT_814424 [Mycena epipterygia]
MLMLLTALPPVCAQTKCSAARTQTCSRCPPRALAPPRRQLIRVVRDDELPRCREDRRASARYVFHHVRAGRSRGRRIRRTAGWKCVSRPLPHLGQGLSATHARGVHSRMQWERRVHVPTCRLESTAESSGRDTTHKQGLVRSWRER